MSESKGRRPVLQHPLAEPQPPQIADALEEAIALHQRGQLAQAEPLYRAILGRMPDHFTALHMLGVIEAQRRNFAPAVQLIGRALQLNPDSAPAHANLGIALRRLKRHEEAIASFERALAIKPDYAEAFHNRGNALLELGRYEDAVASYDRALAVKPHYPEALNNRGIAQDQLKRREEAAAGIADTAAALNDRGIALCRQRRPAEALVSFDQALAIKSDYADALNNRGNALIDLKRYQDAVDSYDRAVAIKPDLAGALNNRGVALRQLHRHREAIASYDRALAIKPDHTDALNNRATALSDLNRPEEAAEAFARLLSLAPGFDYASGNLLHSKQHCCDWENYDQDVERVASAVAAGKRAVLPFGFLSMSGLPEAQLQCARTFGNDKYSASQEPIWRGERYRHDQVRVAYLSADFRGHAVAYLMAGVLEAHDRSRFDITAISFTRAEQDEMRARLKNSVDRFVDVEGKSDRDVALLLKELEIDIAVDLMGYTKGNRLGIFALRPAPIQVNYLGYPGTTGADYIDYILADRFVIREDAHSFYSEKVVSLPETFQPRDARQRIGERTPTRAAAGLPESGFVFCSIHNNYKIAPHIFDVWMRLLRQVDGSVLWLLGDNAVAVRHLQQHAERRSVAPDRLVFAPRIALEDHLARQRLADLFLDTLPYNAGTTASDALWVGLPVLTCAGSSFAGRMAGSLLNAVGLPELITDNLADYEALALALARDGNRLAAIRAKLARHRDTFPLFDTDRFRRHLESAYETMWQRYQRGEPPASFAVAPDPTPLRR
ncbi:MAG TPA: tetratricopeptide repeat protein [Stellaceae bacterium]|jgi:predicted O-linked N-acetylglucosamine transferase (SPINDLY family)|nr:tetratricopeptide repeat protein [Stellaceae bacterium]